MVVFQKESSSNGSFSGSMLVFFIGLRFDLFFWASFEQHDKVLIPDFAEKMALSFLASQKKDGVGAGSDEEKRVSGTQKKTSF